MNWRGRIVVRILLLVARMFCDDAAVSDEIRKITQQIDLYGERHEVATGG